jgi:hypothetical protein
MQCVRLTNWLAKSISRHLTHLVSGRTERYIWVELNREKDSCKKTHLKFYRSCANTQIDRQTDSSEPK